MPSLAAIWHVSSNGMPRGKTPDVTVCFNFVLPVWASAGSCVRAAPAASVEKKSLRRIESLVREHEYHRVNMTSKLALLWLGVSAVLPAADSLSEAAAKRGIRIGAAVQSGYIANEPLYAATLAREYSMIEPEYEMLWSVIHPGVSTFNWAGADKLVDYAQKNGIPLRANHLVWHNSLPSWVTSANFTPEQLRQVMHDHIAAVAGRYAGKVYSW